MHEGDGRTRRPHPTNRSVLLPNGRRLGYAAFGDPGGVPVIFFHGTPGSRVDIAFADGVARTLGVRLLAPDRPGIGRSTFRCGRRLLDWPDDVATFADHLGLERFAALGLSAGGPYAAACAARIPERLLATGIVSGASDLAAPDAPLEIARFERLLCAAAVRAPWLARPLLSLFGLVATHAPARVFERLTDGLVPSDIDSVADEHRARDLTASMRQTFRQGSRGVLHEYRIFGGPWGFDPASIAVPVRLWHGDADHVIPLRHGEDLARRIPQARLTVIPDVGHLLLWGKADTILRSLLADVGKATPDRADPVTPSTAGLS